MSAEEIAHMVTATTATPGWWVVVTAALFAVVVAVSNGWLAGVNAIGVLVHESGHALFSTVTGGEVDHIRLDSCRAGVTWASDDSPHGEVLSYMAGYAAPPLAGVGVAVLLDKGHVPGVLALTVLVMLGVLLVARGWLTVLTVLTVGAAAVALLVWAPVWVQTWSAYAIACLLLAAGLEGPLGLALERLLGSDVVDDDDAAGLRDATGVPEVVWIVGWLALSGWSVWVSAGLLWP